MAVWSARLAVSTWPRTSQLVVLRLKLYNFNIKEIESMGLDTAVKKNEP